METDEETAVAMLDGLCASGSAFSCMELASWYRYKEGLGVPKDDVEGWLIDAAW